MGEEDGWGSFTEKQKVELRSGGCVTAVVQVSRVTRRYVCEKEREKVRQEVGRKWQKETSHVASNEK